mgnify:FL=1
MKLIVEKNAMEVSRKLILRILDIMNEEPSRNYSIALSGGSTPAQLFDLWSSEYKQETDWDRILFFWVDERCVPPTHSDSNYGMTKKILLDKVPIAEAQIFRLQGEADPVLEAARYTDLVRDKLQVKNGVPIFDIVLLGAGDDGHTSSIFPGQEELLTTTAPYAACYNPYNGQKRLALTGQPLINANLTIFLITGQNKSTVVLDMYKSGDTGPAAYVAHHAKQVELYIDKAAAIEL